MGTQQLRRLARLDVVRVAVVLLALAVSTSVLVVRSEAAFTSQTSNVSNRLEAGLVKLTDNAVSTAMFDVEGMVPGEIQQRCIKLVYGGTVPDSKLAPVRLHVTGAGALGPYLMTSVEMGTAGREVFSADETTSCDGFGGTVTGLYNDPAAPAPAQHLTALTSAHGSYATGLVTGWVPVARDEARWFRITFELKDDAAAQDLAATPAFSWEIHSQVAN
jgi:hypothetical protein